MGMGRLIFYLFEIYFIIGLKGGYLMKFKKLDPEYAIFYLIVSIVVPPLFVINLILILAQVISRIIKRKKEKKEIEAYNEIEKSVYNKVIILTEDVKNQLLPLLNCISNTYLGEDSIKIRRFVTMCMLNDMVAQGSIIEFRNFLIYLDDITPKELKLKEM